MEDNHQKQEDILLEDKNTTDNGKRKTNKKDNECKSFFVGLIFFIMILVIYIINIICTTTSMYYLKEPFVISQADPLFWFTAILFAVLGFKIIFPFLLCTIEKNKRRNLRSFEYIRRCSWALFVVALVIPLVTPLIIQFYSGQSHEYYRKVFFNDMKLYDKNPNNNATVWLNNVQQHYRCCGYNSMHDYKEFFKPSSCCNDSNNDTTNLFLCRNPPLDTVGKLNIQFDYYEQGCADTISKVINEQNRLLFYCGLTLCIFMAIILFMAACCLQIN